MFAGKMSGPTAEAEKQKLMLMNYSIHFHCWVKGTFLAFIEQAIHYRNLPLKLIVLRKDAAPVTANGAGFGSRWLRLMARRTG